MRYLSVWAVTIMVVMSVSLFGRGGGGGTEVKNQVIYDYAGTGIGGSRESLQERHYHRETIQYREGKADQAKDRKIENTTV